MDEAVRCLILPHASFAHDMMLSNIQERVRLVTEAEYPLKDSFGQCSLPAYNQTTGVTVKNYTCTRYVCVRLSLLYRSDTFLTSSRQSRNYLVMQISDLHTRVTTTCRALLLDLASDLLLSLALRLGQFTIGAEMHCCGLYL